MWQRLKIAAVGVWLEVTLLPSETITKLLISYTPKMFLVLKINKEIKIKKKTAVGDYAREILSNTRTFWFSIL